MADPTLRSFSQNYGGVSTTNVCPYPAGITAGDRLFLLASGPYHPTALAGWDILYDVIDTNFQAGTLFTKIAAGTESGTNVTLTFSNSDRNSVIIAAVMNPAGYPVVTVFNASSGVPPRVATVSNLHTGSLVLTMATLRDGLVAPSAYRGTLDISSTDGARESAILTHEVLSANEEYWQHLEAGTTGNGYIGAVIEMQAPAYTRALSSAYTSAVMADSPFLFWPLAADAQDASGNARHGTVTGRWNFGRGMGIGSGGDGSQSIGGTSYIRSGSVAFPAGKIAVEVIADVGQTPANAQMVWCLGTSAFDFYLAGGGVQFNNGGANVSAVQRQDGIHHVVVETTPGTDWTTGVSKVYVDGVLRTMSGTMTIGVLGTTTAQVSGWPNDAGQYLPAGYFVGGFAVYAGGLSAARVAAHWAALGTQTSGTGQLTDIASLETMFSLRDLKTSKADGARPLAINDLSRKRRHMLSTNTSFRGAIKAGATVAGAPVLTMGNGKPEPAAYFLQRGLLGEITAAEMLLLFKKDSDPSAIGDGRMWLMSSDGSICHIPYTDGQVYDGFASNARKTTTNPTQSLAAKHIIYNARSAAGAWSNYVEGVLNFTTASNTVAWANAAQIGYANDGNMTGLELVAGAFFSEVLSAPNRALVYAWLDAHRNPLAITDNFAYTALPLVDPSVLPISFAIDNTAFTTEGSEPLTLPTGKTGWAHFVPLVGGVYQLDTIGSNFDTGLALYTGASLGALTLVASDDNSGLLASDTFARADTATGLGSATSGQAYAYSGGGAASFRVLSGQMVGLSTASISEATFDVGTVTHAIRAVNKTAGLADGGLIGRFIDHNNHWIAYSGQTGGVYSLTKAVAGSYTHPQTTAVVAANGDIVELSFAGNVVTLKVNGTQIAQVTDAAHNTATKVGFRQGSSTPIQTWDDLQVDTASGGVTSKLTATLTPGTTYHVQVGSGTGTVSGTIMNLTMTAVTLVGGLVDPTILAGGWGSLTAGLFKGRSTAANDALPGG